MSKPIYVFDGTQWQVIGPVVNEAPISVQATAPTSPATGDVWIDTSEVVPSIDPATLATQTDLSNAVDGIVGDSDQFIIPMQVFR